jgi:putative ABC transport system permease protein
MSLIDAWRHRLRTWLGRSRFERELEEEMRFHREMEASSWMAGGAGPEEASYAARRTMGSEAWHKDEVRRAAGFERLDSIRQDIRYAIRQLRRSPGFTTVVVLALALGIGVNLVIFRLVDGLILNPLPGVANPERVVMVENRVLSYPEYQAYRDQAAQFEGIGAFRRRIVVSARVDAEPERVNAGMVTGNFFTLLKTAPLLGRTLNPQDDQAGSAPVLIVSHAYWKKALGGSPAAVGRTMQVSGQDFTIVGVMPPRFHGLQLTSPSDLWIPIVHWPVIAPGGYARLDMASFNWGWLTMFGVMRPGIDLPVAASALNQVGRRLKEANPDQISDSYQLTLVPAALGAMPDGRTTVVQFFAILTTVVLLVMVLAIANVGNLLLARTAHRHQEIGVRLAIGASRWRLARQFMTEALVLALLAGTTAVLIMLVALRLLRGFTFPGGMTVERLGAGADPLLLSLAGGAVLLTTIVLGVVPALMAVQSHGMTSLRGNPAGRGRPRSRLQSSLLATQIALGLVLLVGAALFTRGLQSALRIDTGMETGSVITATVDVGLARLTPDQAGQYFTAATERIQALPGVEAAGWTEAIPLTDDESVESVTIDGYTQPDGGDPVLEVIATSATYFDAAGIQLLRGAPFDPSIPLGNRHVVAVGAAAARRFWPNRDPLGKRVIITGDTAVVGAIVGDVAYHSLTAEPPPVMYRSISGQPLQRGLQNLTLFVRTAGPPDGMTQVIQRELHAINPAVPVFDVQPFEQRLGDLLLPQRLGVQLLGGFGMLALIIASVGVYGVVGYVVARRTREVGIRMALGESAGSVVLRMILENLWPILVGAASGLALAIAGGRALAGFLYGVSPADPLAYLVSTGILLLASIIAAAIPARRAARVSPMTALRAE